MFVTLSTYFYVGARMLNCSRKDVVYTNADLPSGVSKKFDKFFSC